MFFFYKTHLVFNLSNISKYIKTKKKQKSQNVQNKNKTFSGKFFNILGCVFHENTDLEEQKIKQNACKIYNKIKTE